ncbi:MAG: hypothetical protein HFJ94_07705 [Muribaculaceae bacterium]|nr:hypothetical protein [Muribaculaceae bacterium]
MRQMAVNIALLLAASSAASANLLTDSIVTSTRQTVVNFMQAHSPDLQFDPSFTREQFKEWQGKVTEEMKKLMKHPQAEYAPPKLVNKVRRDGYTVEKWHSYPLEGSVVPFLVLVPDGVSGEAKTPAVLCIPGWGQSKELLAGERPGNYSLEGEPGKGDDPRSMALHFVRNGIIALAIDNPSCGELSDNGVFDYLVTSRFLLENGWSYLGLSSWQDRVALNHLRNRPDVDTGKLIVSGFSLGTEPLMVLGALEKDIYAYVYNDIFCRTRERILCADKPDDKGVRNFPNTHEHLVPGFLNHFDFPDLVANLAPSYLICTEGGMDRDFGLVKRAFEINDAADRFTHLIYNAEQHPAEPVQTVPTGITLSEYYSYLFTAPHYFKKDKVLPWLDNLLQR